MRRPPREHGTTASTMTLERVGVRGQNKEKEKTLYCLKLNPSGQRRKGKRKETWIKMIEKRRNIWINFEIGS